MHEEAFIEVSFRLDAGADRKLLRQIREYSERLRIEQQAGQDDREWIEHLA